MVRREPQLHIFLRLGLSDSPNSLPIRHDTTDVWMTPVRLGEILIRNKEYEGSQPPDALKISPIRLTIVDATTAF